MRVRRLFEVSVTIVIVALTFVVGVANFARTFEPSAAREMFATPAATALLARAEIMPTHEHDRTPIAPQRAIGYIDESRVAGGAIAVRGWVVTPTRTLAQRVFVLVDNTVRYDVSARYGIARPDVAVYLNRAELGDSGVFVRLSTTSLTRGRHHLALAVYLPEFDAFFTVDKTSDFDLH